MYKKIIFAALVTICMQGSAHAKGFGDIIGGLAGDQETDSGPLGLIKGLGQKAMELKEAKDEEKAAKKAEIEMKTTGKMPAVKKKKPGLLDKVAGIIGKKPAKKVVATTAPVAAPAQVVTTAPATPAVVTPPKVVAPLPTPMPAAPAPAPTAPVLATPVPPVAGLAVMDPNKK